MNECRPEKAYLNACCQNLFRRMDTHFGFGPGHRAHLHNASSNWPLDDDGWTDLRSLLCVVEMAWWGTEVQFFRFIDSLIPQILIINAAIPSTHFTLVSKNVSQIMLSLQLLQTAQSKIE
ncbi:hypothetical protein CEXT_626931 [Caerostris extrusa]|uniref:Uncharacterized protein n=1 Tax=Caerostris extrusa TaxID=172846 RepID=A0AAV4M721_CAEEX|nr:hypothetical protein CEXT_626931 [Caerostris extrusa]